MTTERRSTFQVIGVACFIVGVLFAVLSIPFFWQQIRVLESWPVRQAQVISSQVVTRPEGRHGQVYAAQIKIIYAVDGHPVTADLTSYQSGNYAETVRRAEEFPVGSRHAIRYDPNNPSQARVGAGWNRRFFAVPLITLGCGVLFGLLAAGFFIAARISTPAAGIAA
jgi:hypothetical protein